MALALRSSTLRSCCSRRDMGMAVCARLFTASVRSCGAAGAGRRGALGRTSFSVVNDAVISVMSVNVTKDKKKPAKQGAC